MESTKLIVKRLDPRSVSKFFKWKDILFGFGGSSRSTLIWKDATKLTRARWHLQALNVSNKIWALGGYCADGTSTDIDVYDPTTSLWTTIPDPFTYWGQSFVIASNGKIYAVGGLESCLTLTPSVEEYDPTTGTLIARPNIPIACYEPGITTSPDGKIYVIGGCVPPVPTNGVVGGPTILDAVQIYDTQTHTWTIGTSMPTPRFGLSAVMGTDGNVYAMGGMASGREVDLVDMYTPDGNTWHPRAPMLSPRRDFGTATLSSHSGKIYTIGGLQNISSLRAADEFDVTTNTWTARGMMQYGRWYLGVASMGDNICAIGGITRNGPYVPDNSNIEYLDCMEIGTFW